MLIDSKILIFLFVHTFITRRTNDVTGVMQHRHTRQSIPFALSM